MKKTAILSLCILVAGFGIFCFGTQKAEHNSSPAYSAALDQAINRLEGAAASATCVVASKVHAGTLELTQDPITCDPADPKCNGLTVDSRPCITLSHTYPTCDHNGPTCNTGYTCSGRYTCDDRNTCYAGGAATCDAHYTCWNSTCTEVGKTCDGVTPTCDRGAGCDFTIDGTQTCNGSPTCVNTCFGWPTCTPGETYCAHAVDLTTWGKIKAKYAD